MPASFRLALACGALAGVAVFALPLAARTLTPLASLGAELVVAPPSTAPAVGSVTAVGTDGTNFALFSALSSTPVTWVGQRLAPTGARLDPTEIAIPYTPSSTPVWAPGADGYFMVWFQGGSAPSIVSAHLDRNLAGVEAAPVPLVGPSSYGDLAIARATGGSYLLVWTPEEWGALQGLLLDATGAPTGAPFTLATSSVPMETPAVVYGGGNYEVVWSENTNLLAVHVSAAGALLDAAPRTIATTALEDVQLVAASTEDIVTWQNLPGDAGLPVVYAARIGFDGTVLDPGGVTFLESGESTLTYGSSTGVVAGWYAERSANTPTLGVVSEADLSVNAMGDSLSGIDLASNGSVVLAVASSSQGIEVSPVASPTVPTDPLGYMTGSNGAAQVASSGSGYLVAWTTTTNLGAAPGYAVWARPLAADGTPLGEPMSLAALEPQINSGPPDQPSVVWTGGEYVVLWVDGQDALPSFVRVASSGEVEDSTPQVALAENGYGPPYVYAGGNNQFFVISTESYPCAWAFDPEQEGRASFEVILPTVATRGAATAWLDATHLELAFLGASALYGSVIDVGAMTSSPPVVLDSTAGLTRPVAARGPRETVVGAVTPSGSMVLYRLDTTGAVLDGPHTSTAAMPATSGPSLLWDGARYVLAWGSPGDGGTVGYAGDLGTVASPFALTGATPLFAEPIARGVPAIASPGDGGALMVATRALPNDTSVVSAAWTSAPALPPPTSDAGSDAGFDASPGNDGGTDAGTDASSPVDSGPPPVTLDAGQDAGEDDSGSIGLPDSGPITADAGLQDASASNGDGGASGGALSASGCSCRAGAQRGGTPWSAGAAILVVGLGVGRRRRRGPSPRAR